MNTNGEGMQSCHNPQLKNEPSIVKQEPLDPDCGTPQSAAKRARSFGSDPFSEDEERNIRQKLDIGLSRDETQQRPGPGGVRLTYIEGWRVIHDANQIFGFNGWSSTIMALDVRYVDEVQGRFSACVSATVRITLRDGCTREDRGGGVADNMRSKGDAILKAEKEAVTDATKRALKNFGLRLGLSLYDRQHVRDMNRPQSYGQNIAPGPSLHAARTPMQNARTPVQNASAPVQAARTPVQQTRTPGQGGAQRMHTPGNVQPQPLNIQPTPPYRTISAEAGPSAIANPSATDHGGVNPNPTAPASVHSSRCTNANGSLKANNAAIAATTMAIRTGTHTTSAAPTGAAVPGPTPQMSGEVAARVAAKREEAVQRQRAAKSRMARQAASGGVAQSTSPGHSASGASAGTKGGAAAAAGTPRHSTHSMAKALQPADDPQDGRIQQQEIDELSAMALADM